HAGQALAAADVVGELLAVLVVEQRLVVEQVLLRRTAGLEQVDDALGLRREVRGAEHARGRRGRLAGQQCAKGQAAEAEAGGREEVPARGGEWVERRVCVHDRCYLMVTAASRLRIAPAVAAAAASSAGSRPSAGGRSPVFRNFCAPAGSLRNSASCSRYSS